MPPNETTTSTRDLVPPDYNEDFEAYWAWKSHYEENKKKYIEEDFVQSGPVRLLEVVYCDPCKAKVFNQTRSSEINVTPPLPPSLLNAYPPGFLLLLVSQPHL